MCLIKTLIDNPDITERLASDRGHLREAVETLTASAGLQALDVITALQGSAVRLELEDLLEALCELKWDYID